MRNIFLAALFDDDTKEALIKLRLDAKKSELARTTAPVNLHITLGYMREVREEDIVEISQAFDPLQSHGPVELSVRDLGLIGKGRNHLSYLCAMVHDMRQALLRIRQEARELLVQGFPDSNYDFADHGEFIPHITLQRLSHDLSTTQKKNLREKFLQRKFKPFKFTITTLGLMTRDTESGNYKALATYSLSSL